MPQNSLPSWDDTVLPFQLDRCDIRGRVARLDGVLEQILAQHSYPPVIEALVAEATLLTAMIGQMIDLRWKLSLQIRGDGPARIVATDYLAPANAGEPAQLRAYASFDDSRLDPTGDPFAQIGKGQFAILIDQGKGTTPYQGITPLTGGTLSACAETYFAQSEQLPTRFRLAAGRSRLPGEQERWRAGGMMLQQMPKASPLAPNRPATDDGATSGSEPAKDATAAENWNRVNHLLDTVEEMELIGPTVSPTQVLWRLFHEEQPRIFEAQQIVFGCTCSPDRVRQSLSIYSAKDIDHMTNEKGVVTADCQFCGAHYEFEPRSLGLDAAEPTSEPD